MTDKKGKGSGTRVRSAVTGKFVKKSEAKKHPRTTVTERVGKSTTHTGPGKTQKR